METRRKIAVVAGLTVALIPGSVTLAPMALAAPTVTIYAANIAESYTFGCSNGSHSLSATTWGSVNNGCGDRVWLHQNSDGSGWGYCISKHHDQPLSGRYRYARNLQVTSNTNNCS